ncbi:MAG TPA: choline/ethanolamine kinase family protein [Dongiaceae bacterium]|nr:choline/ethanolamine kinase family protein [Dongiaceae bacterium]
MIADADLEARLADAFARIPPLSVHPRAQWRLTLLPSVTNVTIRVTRRDADYVLRLPGESIDIDRNAEFRNMRYAAARQFCIDPLFAEEETGLLLTAFQAGSTTLTASHLHDPGRAFALGRLLGRLHRSALPFAGKRRLAATIKTYLEHERDPRLSILRDQLAPDLALLDKEELGCVPSHIDPSPANILELAQGALLLIDWEFSAMADPAWDVAMVMLADLPVPAQAAFRSGYGDPRLTDAYLATMTRALHLLNACWAEAQLQYSKRISELTAIKEHHISALGKP